MKDTLKKSHSRWIKPIILALLSGCCFYTGYALAGAGPDLSSVVNNITTSGKKLAELITGVSYLAGLGFAMGSILKFKQHKDNPTQIPIGAPIALLLVAASLMFLPTIFRVAGNSVFGGGQSGGFSGVSTIE